MKAKTKLLIFPLFFVIFLNLVYIPFIKCEVGYIQDFVTEDVYILGGNPDDNYEGITHLEIGYNTGYRYTLINLNLTEALEQYGYGNIPDYIYLRLYGRNQGTATQIFDYEVRQITESWDNATVTYNTRPSVSSIIGSGNFTSYHDADTFVYLDITDDFKTVLANSGSGFYGYQVYAVYSTGIFRFDSLETGNYDVALYYSDVPIGEEETDSSSEYLGNLVLDFFMYGLFFVAIPLTMSFVVGGINYPSLGISVFIGSETLMGAIALSIGFIDLWFMIVIIIVDVLLIFTMVKGRI